MDKTDLHIQRLDRGRFDRRFPVGPACWSFWDLLWIHSGAVRLTVAGYEVEITAPAGILIAPNTQFHGQASPVAEASICHFTWQQPDHLAPRNYALPGLLCGADLQSLVALLQTYGKRGVDHEKRANLLRAILDGFQPAPDASPTSRIDLAWHEAQEKLQGLRGLVDVAALVGMSESAFRAEHRAQHQRPAGQHLQRLRLRQAEQLLLSSGMTLPEIAQTVGFAHAESLSAAFSKRYGMPPGRYRRRKQRMA